MSVTSIVRGVTSDVLGAQRRRGGSIDSPEISESLHTQGPAAKIRALRDGAREMDSFDRFLNSRMALRIIMRQTVDSLPSDASGVDVHEAFFDFTREPYSHQNASRARKMGSVPTPASSPSRYTWRPWRRPAIYSIFPSIGETRASMP